MIQQNIYTKNIQTLNKLDVYRILHLYNVTDPCLQHSIKKLLCAGKRGSKNFLQDVSEAISALQRCIEMQQENNNSPNKTALLNENNSATKTFNNNENNKVTYA